MVDASSAIADIIALQTVVRQLQQQIAQKADANPTATSNPTTVTGPGNAPAVSGVTLSSIGGGIKVVWNPAPIQDVKYYEVQSAATATMQESTTIKWTENRIDLNELGQDLTNNTFYVRVRVVTIHSGTGPWSNIINTTTGTLDTTDLAGDSTSQIVEEVITSFSPTSISQGSNAEYGSLSITTEGGIVVPNVIVETSNLAACDTAGNEVEVKIEFLRDGSTVVGSYKADIQTIATNAALTIPGFAELDEPAAGTYTYSVKITLTQKTDEDGLIVSYQRNTTLTAPMPPGYTAEITDEDEKRLLQFEAKAVRRQNGRIGRMPVVKLDTDVTEIDADGIDEAHVTFTNVPSEYTEILVGVGTEQTMVNPSEGLTVTASTHGTIIIHVLEKFLHAKPIKIRAKKAVVTP
jgi:hypothetical protein